MKKEIFYRTKRNEEKQFYFTADNGYLYSAVFGGGALDFAVCKTPFGWDVTHEKSGIKAAPRYFDTRKEALEYISNPDFLDGVMRAIKSELSQKCIIALNNYKKEIKEI